MATVVPSIGLKGLEGYKVHVEVQLIPGIVGVSIVGLPDASVKESKDRVMSALYANRCVVPDRKIIINLSPSEQRATLHEYAPAITRRRNATSCLDGYTS